MNNRALIVDDHPIIRDTLVTSLVSLGVFTEVETCGSLQETMDKLSQGDYGLLILDLSLTDQTGTAGMIRIREEYPSTPIIIFSGTDSTDTIAEAFEWGVHGFISKSSPMQIVINAIKIVLSGGTYIPPSAIRLMGYEPPQETTARLSEAEEHVKFSPKQKEVFLQLMQGIPNKVIADRLSMAEGTVKTHLHSIYQTLNVHNRAQAILRAKQLNLVD